MKTTFLLLFLFPFILTAQVVPKYSSVAIPITQPNMVAYLNENGLEIDHVHQHGKDMFEVTISHEEVALLNDLNVVHEVLIEDLAVNYQELLDQLDPSFSVVCGLSNFDTGEMGSYHSYQDMIDHITLMESTYPDIVQISEIGLSVEGRTIYSVKISDNVGTIEYDSEGVVYYDALTHAREPMGLETILFYMWSLLENYDSDPEITYLINNRELHFVPVVNPDGYVYNQTTNPNGGGFWRKNRSVNEFGCFGVDLNRNYEHEWGNPAGSSSDPCSDLYHGTSAFSEPETQTVRDFTAVIQPSAAFSNHTYSDVFLCPNGFNDDLDRYEYYAEYASEFIPQFYEGYGNWVQTIGYYGAGTTHDYLNSEGVVAYTPEIGHSFWESPTNICDRVTEMYPAMKYMTWISGAYARFQDFEKINEEAIWEGNTTEIKIRLRNRGLSFDAENVQVVLSSNFPGLTFSNGTVDFDDIAPRSFADNTGNPFSFTLSSPVLPGQEIPINVEVYQDGVLSDQEVIVLHAGEANVLFEEDGESGMYQWDFVNNSSLWDTTFIDAVGGAHCITDTRYQNTPSNSNTIIQTTDPIVLNSDQNTWLEFYAKWSFEPQSDYARVLYSIDEGMNWTPLQGIHTTNVVGQPSYTNNSHWVQERINLQNIVTADSTVIYIGFEIDTDFGLSTDGFYFDNSQVVDYSDPFSVAIDEQTMAKNIKVYPNPANNMLYIDFLTSNFTFYTLELTDSKGQIVFQKDQVIKNESIPLSTFPNGVYWMNLKSEDSVMTRKVVVMR